MSIKRAVFEYIQYLLYHEIVSSLLKECNTAVPFGTYQYMQHDLLSIAARYRGVYKYAILLVAKSACACIIIYVCVHTPIHTARNKQNPVLS